jgi:hypothetical protein
MNFQTNKNKKVQSRKKLPTDVPIGISSARPRAQVRTSQWKPLIGPN